MLLFIFCSLNWLHRCPSFEGDYSQQQTTIHFSQVLHVPILAVYTCSYMTLYNVKNWHTNVKNIQWVWNSICINNKRWVHVTFDFWNDTCDYHQWLFMQKLPAWLCLTVLSVTWSWFEWTSYYTLLELNQCESVPACVVAMVQWLRCWLQHIETVNLQLCSTIFNIRYAGLCYLM